MRQYTHVMSESLSWFNKQEKSINIAALMDYTDITFTFLCCFEKQFVPFCAKYWLLITMKFRSITLPWLQYIQGKLWKIIKQFIKKAIVWPGRKNEGGIYDIEQSVWDKNNYLHLFLNLPCLQLIHININIWFWIYEEMFTSSLKHICN